ncbi:NADH-quinone oxidoreductase subunit M [Actinobacteria bacterium YIM 96077]|uniref:NADH-quinone oxidoreductase subunit M n=1 Tax=Phytoactinopolyspora halophila TaxID=1981511 RepID=A0A329QKY9_9ACTN|nr:NADH-quinone oxidoreductase subunit M [Phytoactinopolyspora halophila]AYY14781.1 NADH-quinone oxidoreductase subunit M [Actinobacteria bacterium YIM 96077]RAW13055.1 NADH-quinone oxidoreductase subunit M [Phytoactinopolyspora halophila]
MTFPWLTTLIAVPALGAVLTALVPAGRGRLAKQSALAFALLTLGVAVAVIAQFEIGGDRYQLGEQYTWIDALGIHWALGIDGIGAALVGLAAVATPIVALAMWPEADAERRDPKPFFALLLASEALILTAFLAKDLLLFYVVFEAMLIPLYFMIGMYGGPQRRYAALKFLLYNIFGGLVMLAAVIGVYVQSIDAGAPSFLLMDLMALDISANAQRWLFLGFMLAFAIKAPLWPFHTWLPDAAAEATPSNAAFLSGVADKVGTFGMIALAVPLFPVAAQDFAPVIVVLAVVSIVYGALLAIGQTDIKRLIGYVSISHFGFIVLGIFVLTGRGATGATFYMVNHGLATIALFVIAGFMIARRQSRMIADYGGIQKPAPKLAGAFLIAGLSGLALPPLATFLSEFLVIAATFEQYRAAGVIATVGIVLAALYVLWLYQRTMTGPVPEENAGTRDLGRRETMVVAPLLALILAIGVFPRTVVDVIDDGVAPTLAEVDVESPPPVVSVTDLVVEGNDH